jgi:RNA polymerase sigma-70 factor (ECF subfamily)
VTVGEQEVLAKRFEESRAHLQAVAYRMLGSASEADDAVQDAWRKVSLAGTTGVENLGGWLTTVVARVCLDMLRARKSRSEESLGERDTHPSAGPSPEHETLMAESVGLALLVLLETLAPAERLAYVLHDMFDLPFDDIASIVGCSPAAARQLASRARRRVRGAGTDRDADLTHQRAVVDAFLAASRGGDLGALLALLAPEVVLRADPVAVETSRASLAAGAPKLSPEVRGAAAVADTLFGRARGARRALIDGAAGAVWAPGGKPRGVFIFSIEGGKIAQIEVIVDPERIRELDVEILEG